MLRHVARQSGRAIAESHMAAPVSHRMASSASSPSKRTAVSAGTKGTGAGSRKLTPTAKAKAQASASRALREQLQASKSVSEQSAILARSAAQLSTPPQKLAAIEHDPLSKERAAEQADLALAAAAAQQTAAPSTSTPPVRQIRDVYAYATAEAYDFDVLVRSGRLPADWHFMQEGEVIFIPQWPTRSYPGSSTATANHNELASPSPLSSSSSTSYSPGVGEAFIFRSGSYVTWGISEEQSRKFARSILRGRPHQGGSAEIESYSEIGDEAMEYVIAEDQITRVVGDVIVIGQKPRAEEELEGDYVDASTPDGQAEDPDWSPLLARLAFAQGLCRSARLSVQEAALNKYLEEVADMPARLEAEGKVPLPRRQVIRKMGTLLKLRQRANLDAENFLDDPEMYWENGELEHHYDSICMALDIETRFKAYNEKLDHGENLLGVLRALLTEASTHRMELIIIYLIAFEVCLALISHEYIPSPERVYHFVSDAFTGAQGNGKDLLAGHVDARTVWPNGDRSTEDPTKLTYWQWLKSYIPGLRQPLHSTGQGVTSTHGHLV